MAENMAELEAEIEDLERLVQLARQTEKNATETKFEELRSVISNHISGRSERLLVFTEHKDTLDFLIKKLTNLGFYCCTIHGGMSLEKRIDAEREFYEHKPSILVATEAAGEGINLQFCSLMVNYDIPWNPNRLEQRMGRIHRYKQEREVMIWNIVAENTREGEVMERLLSKLDDMRQALGSDRVYDVIGEIIPAPRFDSLMKDWLSRRRTMSEILAEIDLQTDVEQVQRIRADMEDKALGSRYIDMSKLNADVQQSRENRLMPEYIEKFFIEAYRSFGGTITPVKDRKGVWSIGRVPPDLRKLSESLERRYGKVGTSYPLLTFDKELLVGYSDLQFVGPGHPLFEGVTDRVLRDYGPSLRQGAVFFNADSSEPTVLWLLKCGIEDGRGNLIGERLFAIQRPTLPAAKASRMPCLTSSRPRVRLPCRKGCVKLRPRKIKSLIGHWKPSHLSISARSRSAVIRNLPSRRSMFASHSNSSSVSRSRRLPNLISSLGRFGTRMTRSGSTSSAIVLRKMPAATNSPSGSRIGWRDGARAASLREAARNPRRSGDPPSTPRSGRGQWREWRLILKLRASLSRRRWSMKREQRRKALLGGGRELRWDVTSLQDGQVARYIEVKGRAGVGGVAYTPNEWIKARVRSMTTGSMSS